MPAVFEGRMPSVDVIDRDNEILVRAEIPGVDKKDLDVSVTEDSVCIKGSVQHEEEEEKGEYYRRETSSGSFARTMILPSEVDTAKSEGRVQGWCAGDDLAQGEAIQTAENLVGLFVTSSKGTVFFI
jgi:hypothetical protein